MYISLYIYRSIGGKKTVTYLEYDICELRVGHTSHVSQTRRYALYGIKKIIIRCYFIGYPSVPLKWVKKQQKYFLFRLFVLCVGTNIYIKVSFVFIFFFLFCFISAKQITFWRFNNVKQYYRYDGVRKQYAVSQNSYRWYHVYTKQQLQPTNIIVHIIQYRGGIIVFKSVMLFHGNRAQIIFVTS